ncbi:MAG: NTP transferase domain-containing protein [Candidatus Gastranaerophilales bacterium]|nr:NTP transferase domain-containing protein [Candidatus Gastranaerophilales bacterium]
MDKEIKAIILGAGKGTRMKSSKPKVLHEIFNKPLIGWVIDAVSKLPYDTECIAVIGHGAQQVEQYLNDNYKYVNTTIQKEQLGTGHAVAQAVPLIGNFKGSVIILCGDTPLITTRSLRNLIKYHEENNCDLTVMTAEFENPQGYGRIVRNFKGEVIKIVEEKDAPNNIKEIKEVNTGIYCLEWSKIRQAFLELKNNNAQGEYYLTDIIKWARDNNFKTLGCKIPDNKEIYGINSRKHLAIASKFMNDRHLEELMDSGVTIIDPRATYISPDTTIGADTTIYPNTYIEGKNEIASNCKIGPLAHLRGNCEIGEGCKIGNFVELKNAKVAKNSNVCHLTYIGDAKIGSCVNVGAGTIFANYNSITKEKKLSAVGNNASIGSNSVIVAPVNIGEGAMVAALSCITKDVETEALAMTRTPQKEVKNWVKNKKGENNES